jgi:hypothetical protein
MTADEMLALRRAKPFRPFRAHLADGRTVDVVSHELIMMLGTAVMLGIPPAGATWPIAERSVQVMLKDIVRVEFLDIPELV